MMDSGGAACPIDILNIMRFGRQQRTLRTVALVAIVLSLLVALIAQGALHHTAALAGFVLTPVFLFASMVSTCLLWRNPDDCSLYASSASNPPSAFQLPPPTFA